MQSICICGLFPTFARKKGGRVPGVLMWALWYVRVNIGLREFNLEIGMYFYKSEYPKGVGLFFKHYSYSIILSNNLGLDLILHNTYSLYNQDSSYDKTIHYTYPYCLIPDSTDRGILDVKQ